MSLQVTEQSKLKAALALGPGVLEFIVSLNPHDFTRLRNPLMRRLMPPRIRLGRVALIAGRTVREVLEGVHAAAGIDLDSDAVRELDEIDARREELPVNPDIKPDWAVHADVVVDLLASDERLDADPLPPVMRALKALAPGQTALIKHKWEPAPLYDIWKHMGLDHYAEQIAPNEWHVYVHAP